MFCEKPKTQTMKMFGHVYGDYSYSLSGTVVVLLKKVNINQRNRVSHPLNTHSMIFYCGQTLDAHNYITDSQDVILLC